VENYKTMMNTANNARLKRRVMRRVYAVWFARQITSPFFARVLALFVFMYELHRYASIKNVLHNSPSFFNVGPTVHFFASAFANTDAVTQVLCAGTAAIVFVILRDTVRKISFADRRMALEAVSG
jgi:hypothetical protein